MGTRLSQSRNHEIPQNPRSESRIQNGVKRRHNPTMTAASNMKIIGLIGLVLLCPLASASGKFTVAGVKVTVNRYLQQETGKPQLVTVKVNNASQEKAGKIGKLLMTTDAGKEVLDQYICKTERFENCVDNNELNDAGILQICYGSGNLTVLASMLEETRRRLGWKPSHDIPRRR